MWRGVLGARQSTHDARMKLQELRDAKAEARKLDMVLYVTAACTR